MSWVVRRWLSGGSPFLVLEVSPAIEHLPKDIFKGKLRQCHLTAVSSLSVRSAIMCLQERHCGDCTIVYTVCHHVLARETLR
jgi:hypothetical protein